MTVLQAVDLVDHDDHRHAEREHATRDEAVAGADPIAGGDDEQHRVDVVEGAIDRLLHPLRERVHRSLESREVDEHELPAGPLATPKIRRRVVFGTFDVIATLSPVSALTSVDLPTFGRPATAMKPVLIGGAKPRAPPPPGAMSRSDMSARPRPWGHRPPPHTSILS